MRTFNVYAVEDLAANQFGPPMVARTDEIAKRYFVRMLEGQPQDIREEMRLWNIGLYDEETAVLYPRAEKYLVDVPYVPAKDLTDVR